jgi:hypothetical protein
VNRNPQITHLPCRLPVDRWLSPRLILGCPSQTVVGWCSLSDLTFFLQATFRYTMFISVWNSRRVFNICGMSKPRKGSLGHQLSAPFHSKSGIVNSTWVSYGETTSLVIISCFSRFTNSKEIDSSGALPTQLSSPIVGALCRTSAGGAGARRIITDC